MSSGSFTRSEYRLEDVARLFRASDSFMVASCGPGASGKSLSSLSAVWLIPESKRGVAADEDVRRGRPATPVQSRENPCTLLANPQRRKWGPAPVKNN